MAIVGNLGWPLLLGLGACGVFYVLMFQGPLNTPFAHRYFASHPVAYAEVAMFSVGLAALILKLANVLGQQQWLERLRLGDDRRRTISVADCGDHLDRLAVLPAAARNSYLGRRLHDALEFVERKGSAEGLEDELKYLADLDAARQQDSYALVRIISWATPMLGFLGTVIGITQALGDLNPAEMASSIESAMNRFTAGLYVAFDTTTVALTLSIILMFVQFLIDRIESQLLAAVDDRVGGELVGRFEQLGTSADPHAASIERTGQAMLRAVEHLVQRQVELWQAGLDAAQQRWSGLVDAAGQHQTRVLAAALEQSLDRHARALAEAEQQSAQQVEARWQQWQQSLESGAELLRDQQAEMARQNELLAQVVQVTGDVITLERTLNDNLHALAGAKHFEETVMSLSATIHLLNARLGHLPGHPAAALDLKATKERAA